MTKEKTAKKNNEKPTTNATNQISSICTIINGRPIEINAKDNNKERPNAFAEDSAGSDQAHKVINFAHSAEQCPPASFPSIFLSSSPVLKTLTVNKGGMKDRVRKESRKAHVEEDTEMNIEDYYMYK